VEHGTGLTTSKLIRAEDLWGKKSQKNLLQHKSFRAWEQQFHLFLDSGIGRCKGRIDNAQAQGTPHFWTKHTTSTWLIVEDVHKRVVHNGVKETLTELEVGSLLDNSYTTVQFAVKLNVSHTQYHQCPHYLTLE